MNQTTRSGRRTVSALAAALALAGSIAGCDQAASSADTIRVGYTNREAANGGVPEFRYGGQAAIDYINEHGGINGKKIEPVMCLTDGSPESSINCANQFIDKGVALQFMGLDVGSDAALPILDGAGIPFVATQTGGPAQLADPNSFMLSGLGPDAASLLKALKDGGARRVTIVIYAGQPSIQALADDIVKPVADRLGLRLDKVEVPLTNADWTASVAAALTDPPDAFLLAMRENDCTNALRALRAAKYPGVTGVFACSDYLKSLGASAPPTVATAQVWTPDLRQYAPKDVLPRLDVYEDAMKASGHEDLVNTTGASRTFSAWMVLADILRGIHGPVTAESAKKALRGAADVPGYLGPDLHCGKKVWPSQPSVCSAEEMPLRITTKDGTPHREPVAGGFVDLTDLAS